MSGPGFYQQKIAECDRELERVLGELAGPPSQEQEGRGGGKPGGRNTPHIDNLHAIRLGKTVGAGS